MNGYDVKRLGLILSIHAEIEGMKVANLEREQNGLAPAYSEQYFFNKADELKKIVYKPDCQL